MLTLEFYSHCADYKKAKFSKNFKCFNYLFNMSQSCGNFESMWIMNARTSMSVLLVTVSMACYQFLNWWSQCQSPLRSSLAIKIILKPQLRHFCLAVVVILSFTTFTEQRANRFISRPAPPSWWQAAEKRALNSAINMTCQQCCISSGILHLELAK